MEGLEQVWPHYALAFLSLYFLLLVGTCATCERLSATCQSQLPHYPPAWPILSSLLFLSCNHMRLHVAVTVFVSWTTRKLDMSMCAHLKETIGR